MTQEPRIIAETAEFLIVDKPAGLIVHSDGRTKEPSLAEWLLEKFSALAKVGEPWVSPQGETILLPGIVHRLDRTTSGIMLIAKTPEMYTHLKSEFQARRVEKAYRAYVYGHVEGEDGRIVAEIMRSKVPPKKWYARPCEENDPRAAITEWRLVARGESSGEKYSYIDVYPKTGRTHQIRVHLASIGYPIIADHLYAADRPALFNFKRPALHAYVISFLLPSGEKVAYAAPMPSDFPDLK